LGPVYLTLLVGLVWALAAWGLFRLRNWARWVTMLMLGAGSAWAAATMLSANAPFGWRGVFNWAEIAIRVAAAAYLAQSSAVMRAFIVGEVR
jgi:hypothetical protein